MRDTCPCKLPLWLLLLLPLANAAQASTHTHGEPLSTVSEGISMPDLEQDLLSRHTRYLKKMLDDPEKRREYVERLYTSRKIEEAIIEQGLAQDQALLEELRNARSRLLMDALAQHRIDKKAADIEALAREHYTAHPDQYRSRKKIKLAIIFISKKISGEKEAGTRIRDIQAQLEENPDDNELFHELAKRYSDDVKAEQGGINRKWLLAPNDLEKRDPLMQAAFAMDQIGQLTDIVETETGYAIAKLMAVTPARPIRFDVAKEKIEAQIRSQLFAQTKAELLKSLQAPEDLEVDDVLVKEKITETYHSREPVAAPAEDPGDDSNDE